MSNTLCQPLRTAVVVLLATWTFTQAMAQVQGEYFIDEDPGLGYATPVSIPDDGSVSLVVPTTGLSPGNHIVGIRAYNTTTEANANVVHYGPTVMRSFAVLEDMAQQKIIYVEYFWGDDPGYGKGVPIPVTPGGELSLDNLQISTAGMAPGDYTIGFRALGTTGWGPTVVRNVTVMEEKAPQSILYAEYFWGDDPGYGKGIPIPFTPGVELSLDNLQISTAGMAPGDYTFGFRALGTTGWGPTVVNNVTVMEEKDPQSIVYAEYFWGDDPGFGQGTSIEMEPGVELNFENLAISTKGMAPGDYTIGFRALGTTGWGPTVVNNVTILEEKDPQSVVYAEYFWGDDPGFGQGTSIEMEPGVELNFENLEISTEGMAPGDYTIGFRALGTTGWGPTVVRNVTVMEEKDPQSIVYAEYFWDEDPGYGQGIPFDVEPGEELSLDNLKLSTYGLEPGAHTFGFRALGTTGWGPTVINNVEVMEYLDAQEILYAEYFWDEDPGYGQATSLAMTKNQSVNFDNIELNTDGLTPGDHVLGFRSRGTTGWGPTVIRNVLVMPERESQQVLYAEYFLDDDPGYGLATPITLTPGKEVSISDIEIPSNQDYHLFGFRSYGTSGWGPTMLISVDADIYCDTIHAVRVQEVTLPIKMKNASAVGQFEMTLTLPEGVTVATDKGKLQVSGTTRLDGFTISATTLADNSYRIVATPAAGSAVAIGEGAVVNVGLQIAKGVTSGYYDILLSQVSVCNEYGLSLTRPDTISVLHIENRLLGDVNDDGYVTVSDPVCLISWLLERHPPIFIEEVADFNQDGVITTSDAVAIIRYLLNGAPTPDEPDMDQVSQLAVNSDGHGGINVELHNATDYTAFMMDVTLPESMTLQTVSLNPLRTTAHDLVYQHLGGNCYRIIGFSTMLDTFSGDEGTLFTIKTSGSSSGQMHINHIRFVDTDAVETSLGSYVGSTTGIEELNAGETDGALYRIDGTRAGSVQRGVYIQNGKKNVKK